MAPFNPDRSESPSLPALRKITPIARSDQMKKLISVVCLLALACCLAAQPANLKKETPTWTNPQKAAAENPDFSIQGEYGKNKKNQPWAVQVVALGDGKFDAYLLEGGLPGLGWDRKKKRVILSGSRQGSSVHLASKDNTFEATINGAKITILQENKTLAELPRIVRKSNTLGKKPPKDAVVLFDGKSADAWINGKVENGLLPNSNITTKQKFGSYTLHLEFRTPYKPYARGQARGNSGVYHQGRFETQVLDSFGLEGRDNECGGIYKIAQPRINMCYPPLTWQTYDVNFTAARFDPDPKKSTPAKITVKHNGITIHKNQKLPTKATTAAPNKDLTSLTGPIHIQHHKNPVYYRNIWIIPK